MCGTHCIAIVRIHAAQKPVALLRGLTCRIRALDVLKPFPSAGAGEYLTLKEYKLMVEAGQLAPYKGSLPSADAKYAAGWAMKRCAPRPTCWSVSGFACWLQIPPRARSLDHSCTASTQSTLAPKSASGSCTVRLLVQEDARLGQAHEKVPLVGRPPVVSEPNSPFLQLLCCRHVGALTGHAVLGAPTNNPVLQVVMYVVIPGCSEAGRSLLAVDTNVLMERGGRAALAAWLAASDGASALLIPHVRLGAASLLRAACRNLSAATGVLIYEEVVHSYIVSTRRPPVMR